MNLSRAMVFAALVLFMAGGLFLSTAISETAAVIAAFMLSAVGGITLLLSVSHARR